MTVDEDSIQKRKLKKAQFLAAAILLSIITFKIITT